MNTGSRRILRRMVASTLGAGILLCFFALVGWRCRDAGIPPAASPAAPIALRFSTGERFVYSAWRIDRYGYVDPSSLTSTVRRVAATGVSAFGRDDAVAMVDSSTTDSLGRLDTLFYRFGADGDVYQYGFVSAIMASNGDSTAPRRWDRIAAFSLGAGSSWIVQQADSAGATELTGSIGDLQSYFEVDVNGVQTLVAAYRVGVSGVDGEVASVWVSDSPPSFTQLALDPGVEGTPGELMVLESIRSAGHP
jgi:hypothetical protein